MRGRIYYVYASNHTDSRDDEVWKVRASSKEEAREWASQQRSNRFSVRQVYTAAEMKAKADGWWALLRNTTATEIE